MRGPHGRRRGRSSRPAAIVLHLNETGLGAVRSLGRAGVPVLGLDFDGRTLGFASRYCTARRCPHPTAEPEALLHYLLGVGRQLSAPAVLVPVSDAFVLFLSSYREELQRYFRYTWLSPELMEATVNKRKQYDLAEQVGIPYPATYYPESMGDVRALQHQLDYPVFIKPYYSHLWFAHFGNVASKGFQVATPPDLVACYEQIFPTGLRALIQTIVPGPTRNLFKARLYIGRTGQLLAAFTWQKLREYPLAFGLGTLAGSVHVPELVELGLRFCQGIGYHGIASLEFKRDAKDGQLKLMELNPRLELNNILAADCGVNFPLIHYLDLLGAAPQAQLDFPAGVRWVDGGRDALASWALYRAGELSPAAWLRSLAGVRSFATFALDDPGPFLKKNWNRVASLRRALARALRAGAR